jgi:catechol 2,3-dioxygenase-like lactoylglutathione lyase family enzyme
MGGSGISGIDHLVVKVRDLDRAREAYGRLGFKLTPPARHGGLGTANHTAALSDRTYLEFLAIEDPKALSAPFDVLRDQKEGFAALALRTADVRDLHHKLTAEGLEPGRPVSFSRPVDLPDGPAEARFTAAPLPAGILPGAVALAFEQHTPDYVWQPDYLNHENGALGVAYVVVASDRPEETAAAYAKLFRVEPQTYLDGAYTVAVGPHTILIATPALLHWAWTADPLLSEPRPFLAGIFLRVEDLHRAQQALQKSRMPVICSGGVLRVTSQHTLGVALAFAVEPDLAHLLPT